MYKNKKILAIIPARGGSKGIPKKNIKNLAGKPLIYYTINSATKSNVFDKIIVSTDSKEIAEISRKYGVEVPFIRPKELSTDKADGMDVIIHAIKFLEEKGEFFDYIMKLQPTSPLRNEKDIIDALNLATEKNANSIISVSECKRHPLWSNILNKNREMKSFIKEDIRKKNRQDLPKYYELNGMIFLAKTKKLLETKDWFMDESFALIIDKNRAIDIDDIVDFKLAEILINKNLGESCND